MLLYIKILKESLKFAINALTNNKLRTFLSLLGVTVGIYSIIAVLAAVDSMKNNIESSLSSMDKNTIYLFKFSFGPTDVPKWKRNQFKNVSIDEYYYLKKNLNNAQAISYCIFTGSEAVKYEEKTASNINIKPFSYEYFDVEPVKLDKGRLYNESESNAGNNVIVLGYEVAQTLFEGIDPIGKSVKCFGRRYTVIGTIKKMGQDAFGDSNDISAFIPANSYRKIVGDNNEFVTPAILIRPEKNIDIEEFKADISQKMRTIRGIKPNDINTFFINVLAGFTEMVGKITGMMNLVGWLICGFSLLVGGFGISNIMFVSVKERTNLIGIQKALGAKNKFILFQFLFEAIILAFFGGLAGIILVWLTTLILNSFLDFEFILSINNILIGTFLSIFIGLISGIIPAISASKLDPVEAIRTGM